ncbi:TetR/AcrR family transcriptional regulator [Nesterenkonia ebinurensis]|uniref:TetR/AcrR family transcriptional regulator n=1 Tax=Nesterenkonia ebinurensis TaxID=2608252 RepID=UPI00123DB958|nr:TetR family transcriptional regulator C-terminal domain-containing protein [Nesterenkonia ebinurensis]
MAKGEMKATRNHDRALEAAVEIVGTQGIHSLTHGQVDISSGLPKGSTSNYFRTRAALIHATVGYLVRAEQNAFNAGTKLQTTEDLVKALTEFVHDASGRQRTVAAARLAFFIEAFHDPQVRETLSQARHDIDTWAARTLETLGFPAPFAAARRILAQLEGMVLHNLTFGDHSVPREDIAAVIRSCL